MSQGERLVYWERREGCALVTIDNPPVNALRPAVVQQLHQRMQEIGREDSVNAVVLTGAGDKAFVAGLDVRELEEFMKPESAAREWMLVNGNELMFQLADLPKVTIAAINGHALGGGCEVALCCDLRVMDERATIGLTEVRLGVLPGGQGTQRLARLVGAGLAKELMFTGDAITAADALRIGLVNQIAPAGEAVSHALRLAQRINRRPGRALALIKRVINQGLERSLREGVALETQAFREALLTEDAQEGARAFLEKRPPQYRNR